MASGTLRKVSGSEKDAAGTGRDFRFGRFAEEKAVELLVAKGYAIRHRNWRCGRIEIDIIAQKADWIVFVEVKARSGEWEAPDAAVDRRKMKSLSAGADVYLRGMPVVCNYRFDIITLTGNIDAFTIEHIEDAFMPPLSGRGAGSF